MAWTHWEACVPTKNDHEDNPQEKEQSGTSCRWCDLLSAEDEENQVGRKNSTKMPCREIDLNMWPRRDSNGLVGSGWTAKERLWR